MLGLYVHVPFCEKICDYCDFSAIKVPNYFHLEYLDLVNCEIAHFTDTHPGVLNRVDTLYVGGGTPSLLLPEEISCLYEILGSAGVPLRTLRESTMEFNPESCDAERLAVARECGVDRVSIGIQTFDGALLNRIGRSHDAGTGEAALELLTGVSGLRVSADLMFNLPGQTLDNFLGDLRHLSDYPLGHISFYGLKVDPHTRLGYRIAQGKESVDEDLYAPMYRQGVELLAGRGFDRYETSNFAKRGDESLHNLNYWRRGEYLAFGPGAHGFFGGVRYHTPEKYAPWRNYVKSGFPQDMLMLDPIGKDEALAELVQLSFRTREGLDLAELHEMGREIPEKVVLKWVEKGLLERAGNRLSLVGDGWLFMDRVVEDVFLALIPYSNLE